MSLIPSHKAAACWKTALLALGLGFASLGGRADARPDERDIGEECAGMLQPAADEPRTRLDYDEATGRDLRNYPPHRLADFRHMKLEITILDMNQTRLDATQTLTIAPIAEALSELVLDARGMDIETVTAASRSCTFKHENEKLTIWFDPPLEVGMPVDVVTRYRIEHPQDGLYWFPESPDWPGRPAQLHTQGESQTISSLFPCHDFPNERLTTELTVTVPAGYQVCSNGRLVERTNHILTRDIPEGGTRLAAYERFHWLQDKPIVNYLVTLVVGKFDVVDVGTKKLPMPVYAPLGRGGDVKATYGKTPEMIALFSKLLDEPYPWDKYAQVIVWNFTSGGMENASATTMYDTAVIDKASLIDTDFEGLISHELAHQWFGDLMTCNSWEHIWLNEGMATYMTSLWYEHKDGLDGYQSYILGNMDGLREKDKPEAPYRLAMASKIYKNPRDPFRKPANPYGKGSSILHMLRQRLGDDAFFKGLALYIDRYKLQTVETSELRRAFEDVSGESLDQFFAQWCFRPGVPTLDIKVRWDEAGHVLNVELEQKQNIDGDNPAYEFDLPIWVDVPEATGGRSGRSMSETGRWLTLSVNQRSASAAFALPGKPTIVAVDPNLAVLAQMNIDQSADFWIPQLKSGPTLAAKVQAARALGKIKAPESAQALRLTINNRQLYRTIRESAVKALETQEDWETLGAVVNSANDTPDIRRAIGESLGKLASSDKADPGFRDFAGTTLLKRARDDASSRVRSAAILALAHLKTPEAWTTTVAALSVDSQDDRIRQAALEALSTLDRADGLPHAIEYTKPGHLSRTRPRAIQTVVDLAKHKPDAAYEAIAPLLADREVRTRDAAGQALADLKDPRGVAVLEKFIAECPDLYLKQKGQEWLDALRKKLAPTPPPAPVPSESSPSSPAAKPETAPAGAGSH